MRNGHLRSQRRFCSTLQRVSPRRFLSEQSSAHAASIAVRLCGSPLGDLNAQGPIDPIRAEAQAVQAIVERGNRDAPYRLNLIKIFRVTERGELTCTLARGIRNAEANALDSRSKSCPWKCACWCVNRWPNSWAASNLHRSADL